MPSLRPPHGQAFSHRQGSPEAELLHKHPPEWTFASRRPV